GGSRPTERTFLPVSTSHRPTLPIASEAARVLPSEERETFIPTGPPQAIMPPPGCIMTSPTLPAPPPATAKRRTSFPLETSQTRTKPSEQAVTTCFGEEKATKLMAPGCRQRRVPIRALAPSGKGSPKTSLAFCFSADGCVSGESATARCCSTTAAIVPSPKRTTPNRLNVFASMVILQLPGKGLVLLILLEEGPIVNTPL